MTSLPSLGLLRSESVGGLGVHTLEIAPLQALPAARLQELQSAQTGAPLDEAVSAARGFCKESWGCTKSCFSCSWACLNCTWKSLICPCLCLGAICAVQRGISDGADRAKRDRF